MKPTVQRVDGTSMAAYSSTRPYPSRRPAFKSWITQVWTALVNELKRDGNEPRVWTTRDAQGTIWWSAVDPETNRAIYRVSEADIRRWIEERHRTMPHQTT